MTVPGGKTSHRSPETRRYYGVSWNDYLWCIEYYTDSSTNWRDKDVGTNWSSRKDDEKTSSNACTEGLSGPTWRWPASSLWWKEDSTRMRADVGRVCMECESAMVKRRGGRREPLHQYIVALLMERLAMGVGEQYPINSLGNQ